MRDNKVLVELSVPAANKKFDIFIPVTSKMFDVRKMLVKVINDLCEGTYIASDDVVICEKESGIIYNINLEIAELGIENGTKLIMI